jgi:hypothetical protein
MAPVYYGGWSNNKEQTYLTNLLRRKDSKDYYSITFLPFAKISMIEFRQMLACNETINAT